MNKNYSFILSAFWILLVSILCLSLFTNSLSVEFNKTFIIHTTPKKVEPDARFLSYFTGQDASSQTVKTKQTLVETKTGSISAIAFWDTHFTRWFSHYIKTGERKESDYFTCFSTGSLLSYDIVSVNLETSVAKAEECQKSTKSIVFRTEPQYLKVFKNIGITHFNLANNHSYDCWKTGYSATKEHLQANGSNFFGEGRGDESVVATQNIRWVKLAFIGLSDIEIRLNLKEKAALIKEWKDKWYVVIVNIHFGTEYQKKHNKTQENIAHTLVDNGAAIIIGHHPHVVQDSETYKGVPIYYSLGNFIFDQPFPETLEGLWLTYEITADGVKNPQTISFKRHKKYYEIEDCSVF